MEVLEELRQAQLLRKEQAREQAYLARVAQLEREREAAAAQENENGAASEEQSTAVEGAAASAEGTEESGRKRRRQVTAFLKILTMKAKLVNTHCLSALLLSYTQHTASGLPSVGQGTA